jgi:hypothetical protein
MAAIGGALALVLLAPTFDLARWLPFAVAGCVALAALVVVLRSARPHPPVRRQGSDPRRGAAAERPRARRAWPHRSGPARSRAPLGGPVLLLLRVRGRRGAVQRVRDRDAGGQRGPGWAHGWGWRASPSWRWPYRPGSSPAASASCDDAVGGAGLAAAVAVAGSTDVHALLTVGLAFAGRRGRCCWCRPTPWSRTKGAATASVPSPGCTTCSAPGPPSWRPASRRRDGCVRQPGVVRRRGGSLVDRVPLPDRSATSRRPLRAGRGARRRDGR